MSEFDLSPLEPHQEMMVRDALASELDPQLGRAQERFRQFLTEGSPAADDRYRIGGRFRGWVFSVAGAAIAACLGFLAAGPSWHSSAVSSGRAQPVTPVSFPWMQQTVDQQMYDGGTVVGEDGQPVRVLQRRKWETTRWFDEQKRLKAESVVPQDETLYLKMRTD